MRSLSRKDYLTNRRSAVRPSALPRVKTPPAAPKLPVVVEPGMSVVVPQGLGDIFWVYQKLAPHVDRLNFRIAVTHTNEITRRSEKWLSILPKVGSISYRQMNNQEYEQFIQGTSNCDTEGVLRQYKETKGEVKYCCNRLLEEGTRIDRIDKYEIATDVPVKAEEFDLPFKKYVTLYVSGSTKPNIIDSHGVWTVEKWVDFLLKVYEKLGINYPVILVGAQFDKDVMDDVQNKLCAKMIPTVSYVQLEPEKVCHIFNNTNLFIGYQSGLNIIADNLDVPQIMLYFHILEKMQYTWCKEKNIKTLFHSATFAENVEVIINRLDALKRHVK